MDESMHEKSFASEEKSVQGNRLSRIPFRMKKDNFLIMILIGILFLVIVWPVGEEKKDTESLMNRNTNEITEISEEKIDLSGRMTENDMLSYSAYLEKDLEEVLADMDGAGRVKVMVTIESSREAVLEKDVVSLREGTTEVDSAGGSRNTTHISNQEETVFTDEGSSAQTPYVKKINAPKVQGVLVAAEGGQNAKVVKNITEAIQALFGIEAHKIKIVKMNSR